MKIHYFAEHDISKTACGIHTHRLPGQWDFTTSDRKTVNCSKCLSAEPLYVQVENTERRREKARPELSELRGKLWFWLLPDDGKRDCAVGQAKLWLKGATISDRFLTGVAEAASAWESEEKSI